MQNSLRRKSTLFDIQSREVNVMKNSKNQKNIKIFTIGSLIITILLLTVLNLGTSPVSGTDYTYTRIITHNSHFLQQGFVGLGTEAQPYRFEGHTVVSPYGGIYITGTTAHFVISACTIVSTGTREGIYLQNVQNGKILDNTIYNVRHGIYLHSSHGIRVEGNTVYNTAESGMRLFKANQNIIYDNTIYNCAYNGIWLSGSSSNTIEANNIYNCYTGIWAKSGSAENVILSNTIYDNDNGIWISSSDLNEITYNYLYSNDYGTVLTETGYTGDHGITDPIVPAENNTIEHNNYYLNKYYGIIMGSGCNMNTLGNNSLLYNNKEAGTQVSDSGADNVILHNFYDDWCTPDVEPDGIVDVSYQIDGTTQTADSEPLANPVHAFTFDYATRPTVKVPIGRETTGGNITIEWQEAKTTTASVLYYTVYLSDDNGSTWTVLAGSLTNTYSLFWSTYYTPNGTEYVIKVVVDDLLGLTAEDSTDGPFTLYNPAHIIEKPYIITPNGGITVNGMTPVRWLPVIDPWLHNITYGLYYSNDSGINWYVLNEGLTTADALWDTTTVSDGPFYRIKVIATCETGLITEDTSDNDFRVQNIGHILSNPHVVAPNGGETVVGDYEITWNPASDSEGHAITYSIYYTNDSGISWYLIIAGVSSTNTYWDTTPVADADSYMIKVKAICSAGFSSEDISDDIFSIINTEHSISSVTILSPNGGESVSGVVEIKWTAVSDSLGHSVNYTVSYSNDSGTTWFMLAEGFGGSTYNWVTSSVDDGTTYKVKVVAMCEEGLTTEDASDNTFTIENYPHIYLSSLELFYPNGGETLNLTIQIQWTSLIDSWGHAVYYTLYYSDDSGSLWYVIAEDLTTNSYNWDSTAVSNGADYMLKVVATCSEGSLIDEDNSDAAFTIENEGTVTTTDTSSVTSTSETSSETTTEPSPGFGIFEISIFLISITIGIQYRRTKKK